MARDTNIDAVVAADVDANPNLPGIPDVDVGDADGIALIFLGVATMAAGILYHVQFMRGLRLERIAMSGGGLIHGLSHFPYSFTLLVAIFLLLLGIAAIASVTFRIGPFLLR